MMVTLYVQGIVRNGQLELLDLPPDLPAESFPIIVEVTPHKSVTGAEILASGLFGIGRDPELPDSAEFVQNLRREEEQRRIDLD